VLVTLREGGEAVPARVDLDEVVSVTVTGVDRD
jgi:hypothetical protein